MLESLGIDWRLFLFQIVNFLILLFILKKVLYKPVLGYLESRQKKIEDGLKMAEKIEAEWEKIQQAAKARIAEVEKQSFQIIEEARRVATSKEKEVLDLTQQKSAKIIEEAKKEMMREREKIAEELKAEMSELVVLATEKILKRGLKASDEKELIKEAIKSIAKK